MRARLRPAVHRASVPLRVGAGIPEAVAEGYRLNLPLCSVTGVRAARVDPLIEVDHPAVVVEAVKLAEDRSGDLIVRLSETHGSRMRARVIRHFAATDVTETDLLERPLAAPRAPFAADGSALTLELPALLPVLLPALVPAVRALTGSHASNEFDGDFG